MQQYTREELTNLQNEDTDFSKLDAMIEMEQHVSENPRFAGDAKLYAQFFSKPVKNPLLTEEQKRPIYENTDYVKIMVPGDKLNINIRPATDEDKFRFQRQYSAYLKNASQEVGTPLSQVPFLNAAQVEELKFFHITTVEALAGINDSIAQKFMGMQAFKQQAQEYLKKANDLAGDTRDKQIAQLQEQVAALLAAQKTAAPSDEEVVKSNDKAPELQRTLHVKK